MAYKGQTGNKVGTITEKSYAPFSLGSENFRRYFNLIWCPFFKCISNNDDPSMHRNTAIGSFSKMALLMVDTLFQIGSHQNKNGAELSSMMV